jgi:hydrogenase nickel incorporation protein HypA/HybF
MHELSIASSIVERAQAVSAENGHARVVSVGLRIGDVSGIEPDALTFGFEALCKDTPLAGAKLEIERCKRTQRCAGCGTEFFPVDLVVVCPVCRSSDSVCIAGKELDILYFELEDPPCA